MNQNSLINDQILETIIDGLVDVCYNPHKIWAYVKYVMLATERNTGSAEYTEKHHILPKYLFPQYADFSKNPWNKAILTYRQHFIAHYMLEKIICDGKNFLAINWMPEECPNQEGTFLEKLAFREKARILASERQKAWLKENHPFRGKTHSEESRAKIKAGLYWRKKIEVFFLEIKAIIKLTELQHYLDQGWSTETTQERRDWQRELHTAGFRNWLADEANMEHFKKECGKDTPKRIDQRLRMAEQVRQCPVAQAKKSQKMSKKRWYYDKVTYEAVRLGPEDYIGPNLVAGRPQVFVNNGVRNLGVLRHEVEEYVRQGWFEGQLPKPHKKKRET